LTERCIILFQPSYHVEICHQIEVRAENTTYELIYTVFETDELDAVSLHFSEYEKNCHPIRLQFNPSWAAPFFDLRFCTSRALARVYLIQWGQLFHDTIACPCERAGIENQPMPHASCGVSASEAKLVKNRLFESNNGTDSADAKQSMVMQRHQAVT